MFEASKVKLPGSWAQDCYEAVAGDLHVHHLLSLVFLTEEGCVTCSQRFKTIVFLPKAIEILSDILELDLEGVLDNELLLLECLHVCHVTQIRMLTQQLPGNLRNINEVSWSFK